MGPLSSPAFPAGFFCRGRRGEKVPYQPDFERGGFPIFLISRKHELYLSWGRSGGRVGGGGVAGVLSTLPNSGGSRISQRGEAAATSKVGAPTF